MVHDAWFHAKFDHCRRAGISADRESGCVTSVRKVTCTTGDRNFVVCLLHKAKLILLTAKALSRVQHTAKATRQTTVGKGNLCRVPFVAHTIKSSPCAHLTHGKKF